MLFQTFEKLYGSIAFHLFFVILAKYLIAIYILPSPLILVFNKKPPQVNHLTLCCYSTPNVIFLYVIFKLTYVSRWSMGPKQLPPSGSWSAPPFHSVYDSCSRLCVVWLQEQGASHKPLKYED